MFETVFFQLSVAFILVVKGILTINTPHIMVKRVTRNKYHVVYVTVMYFPAAQENLEHRSKVVNRWAVKRMKENISRISYVLRYMIL